MERQLTLGRITLSMRYETSKPTRQFWTPEMATRLKQIYAATWEVKSAGKLPLKKGQRHEP